MELSASPVNEGIKDFIVEIRSRCFSVQCFPWEQHFLLAMSDWKFILVERNFCASVLSLIGLLDAESGGNKSFCALKCVIFSIALDLPHWLPTQPHHLGFPTVLNFSFKSAFPSEEVDSTSGSRNRLVPPAFLWGNVTHDSELSILVC